MRIGLLLVLLSLLFLTTSCGGEVGKTERTPIPTIADEGSAVTLSMPEVTPCDLWDKPGGCYWYYTAWFRNTSGKEVTVDRISQVYQDRNGFLWASEYGKWTKKDWVIPAGEKKTFSSWVRSQQGTGYLASGWVIIGYEGRDAEGNMIKGSVASKLAPRK